MLMLMQMLTMLMQMLMQRLMHRVQQTLDEADDAEQQTPDAQSPVKGFSPDAGEGSVIDDINPLTRWMQND